MKRRLYNMKSKYRLESLLSEGLSGVLTAKEYILRLLNIEMKMVKGSNMSDFRKEKSLDRLTHDIYEFQNYNTSERIRMFFYNRFLAAEGHSRRRYNV